MYIILRRAVGGREESSDVRGELKRENLWWKVLEVGRSQAILWLVLSDVLLRKMLYIVQAAIFKVRKKCSLNLRMLRTARKQLISNHNLNLKFIILI